MTISEPDDQRDGWRRYSITSFLIALVAFVVLLPFLEWFAQSMIVKGLLLTLVLLSAVPAVGGDRRSLGFAIALVIPALLSSWYYQIDPDPLVNQIAQATSILFVTYITLKLFRFIMHAPIVNAEVLHAAMATYLLLALAWSFAYMLVFSFDVDAFAFSVETDPLQQMLDFEAFYFSVTTLTTLGYGDIVPVSKVARMLTSMEAICGLFYMAFLVSRLVSVYSANRLNDQSTTL